MLRADRHGPAGLPLGYLVEGLRRAILLTALPEAEEDEPQDAAAGVLLLADDDSIEMASAAAQTWLAELKGDRGRTATFRP